MIKSLRKILLVACLAAPSVLPAQVCLVSKGKPQARIVLAEDNDVNRKAAQLLQRFVRETSGGEVPIVANGRRSKNCVVIGESTNEATDDGYVIDCSRGTLAIKTAGGKGAIYGVAALLEKQLGVDYLAKDFYTLTPSVDVRIPQMHVAESPAFRFRQTFSYSNNDSTYRDWMRLQEHREMFAADMWVHTFDRLLPSSVYGKSHPEYYSFINGERRPGNHSQWCLTNPDIFEIVAHRIDSIFKANPNQNMISVSQNDGNDTYCQCPECRKVNEYEGSPAGCYVRFLNRLAERFPDKQFSTLAYLFTMHPPKHVKPLPNVNIMLCDIDTKREVPLTDNESGRDFVRALEGWAKISNNIFVWDYGINFDNVVAPFPNFHILKKNIQLFKRNHATMLFEQVNGTLGTDFAELRAYMLGKLMWTPSSTPTRSCSVSCVATTVRRLPISTATSRCLPVRCSHRAHRCGYTTRPLRTRTECSTPTSARLTTNSSLRLKRRWLPTRRCWHMCALPDCRCATANWRLRAPRAVATRLRWRNRSTRSAQSVPSTACLRSTSATTRWRTTAVYTVSASCLTARRTRQPERR